MQQTLYVNMSTRRSLKLSSIMKYFACHQEELAKAEGALESKTVAKVHYDEAHLSISGSVFSIARADQLKVELFLTEEREIKEAFCSCLEYESRCYHVAALALYAHYNISQSYFAAAAIRPRPEDLLQRNNSMLAITDSAIRPGPEDLPRKNNSMLAITDSVTTDSSAITDSVIRPTPEDQLRKNNSMLAITDSVTTDSSAITDNSSYKSVKEMLEDYEEVSRSPQIDALGYGTIPVPNIGSLIFSQDFLKTIDKSKYLAEKCAVAKEAIEYLSSLTIGRTENPIWTFFRRYRLIDAHFGPVLRACTLKKFPVSLFEKLTGNHNLDNAEHVHWRKEHEAIAIQEFTRSTGLDFIPMGLWLHPCGFLGASPDGIASDGSLVEIKCPFQYKDSDLKSTLSFDDTYICKYLPEEDRFVLNINHDYYRQIQGQLCLLNRNMCYLVIWTPQQTVILNVERNSQWAHNISTLQDFYLKNFVRYIAFGE